MQCGTGDILPSLTEHHILSSMRRQRYLQRKVWQNARQILIITEKMQELFPRCWIRRRFHTQAALIRHILWLSAGECPGSRDTGRRIRRKREELFPPDSFWAAWKHERSHETVWSVVLEWKHLQETSKGCLFFYINLQFFNVEKKEYFTNARYNV